MRNGNHGLSSFIHLEIFLRFLNDFSLVQFVDLHDILFRQIFETFSSKEENFELKDAFAGCHTAEVFQQFLEVLSQSENHVETLNGSLF